MRACDLRVNDGLTFGVAEDAANDVGSCARHAFQCPKSRMARLSASRTLAALPLMTFPIPTKQINRQDEPLITTVLRRFQIALGYSFLQLQERT
jgi:hypothetical protein